MALQLRKTVTVRARRAGRCPTREASLPTWRPFQMGFILQCLASLADPAHADRRLADLLWFPTGGGKTEAYLGLTAFTLALGGCGRTRRARDRRRHVGADALHAAAADDPAVPARARALCAPASTCGASDAADVGRRAVPHRALGRPGGDAEQLRRRQGRARTSSTDDRQVYEGSPYQLLFCPWCGDGPRRRSTTRCRRRPRAHAGATARQPSATSAARESQLGLPVLMVDEEIYRNLPSLLIATVDKFAQMPWNGQIQALFGRVESALSAARLPLRCREQHAEQPQGDARPTGPSAVAPSASRLAPPDLIIQDELHLISGPLGTLVGLYETAVDALCSRELDGRTVRPKVIASTATIRRARRQVEGAVRARASPSSRRSGSTPTTRSSPQRADRQEAPGRRYVGDLRARASRSRRRSSASTAALLSRALAEFEARPGAESDAYMTLVGYFNSLRELGGALRLVEDDVPARLRVLREARLRAAADHLREPGAHEPDPELARSRRALQQLERHVHRPGSTGAYPVDVLLASNMISVGVDIDRLGLDGRQRAAEDDRRVHPGDEPRRAASTPGWSSTSSTGSRPRDISHYERFRHYHETFYRHVEATSVTPVLRASPGPRAAGGARVVRPARRRELRLRVRRRRDFRKDNRRVGAHRRRSSTRRAFDATNREDVRHGDRACSCAT